MTTKMGCGHGALVQVNGGGEAFWCGLCREYGGGARVVCQQCESYELHRSCAEAPAALSAHPLHAQHVLVLFPRPPKGGGGGGGGGPKCEVCHKACRGHTFRCCSGPACSFHLHPCCAALAGAAPPPLLHHHPLHLAGPADSAACALCHRKRSGRVLLCSACDYQLHAACAKAAFNGLQPNQKPNTRLGTAAKLASQVVIDFIGGLIEGIAEGVGQVIAQDALKGSSSKTNNTDKPK